MKAPATALVRGFTLIEMAVVVAVIALLLGSILVPLATQIEERRIAETKQILSNAREALFGFVILNGRLPCPATSASNGIEQPSTGGVCTAPHNGFLPAATLGLSPTDSEGFAVDPWGNRIRYAVTGNGSNSFTTATGIATAFLAGTLTQPIGEPDLRVCSTAAGVTSGDCAAGKALTTRAPAVLFSIGANGATGPPGADEVENTNSDRVFVSRLIGAVGSTEGAFDDIVVWISPHVLYGQLVAAGKLP